MWLFNKKGGSGFSSSSTAEEVTQGIDGTGLTAIVTGASGGIGAETTRALAMRGRGVHVIMAVRNVAAGEGVKEALVKEIPSAKVDVMELDLSSLASVRKFASDYNSLDLLDKQCRDNGTYFQALQRQYRTKLCHKSPRSFSFDKSFVGQNEENNI